MAGVMAFAQQRGDVVKQADGYEWPTDPAVLQKLDEWQDLKFGVLMHWGVCATQGMVESWAICNEEWIRRPEGSVYEDYKKWYWDLSKEFNPVKFNPDQWAEVFDKAGMKYMIFTTKHHDGFALFDSEYSDFTIAKGPFGDNPRKDAAKEVFNAFRDQGFMIGAYFSKPDWHHPGFWNPYYATPDRRPNYRRSLHPDWWESYVQYTGNQLREITSRYGRIDILWLDGGWITGEEVGIDSIIDQARDRYPGMIAVDRTIKGKNENYQTPERGVPEGQILHPWESCIPLSNDWGWVKDAPYKSWDKVIATLAEITAKGGCLVLGVGPTAEGIIEEREVNILREIGAWLQKNGEAIYSTRPTPNFVSRQEENGQVAGTTWFTASKDGSSMYAIYVSNDYENGSAGPRTLSWTGNIPSGKMTLLSSGKSVRYKVSGETVTVTMPKGRYPGPVAFKFAPVR